MSSAGADAALALSPDEVTAITGAAAAFAAALPAGRGEPHPAPLTPAPAGAGPAGQVGGPGGGRPPGPREGQTPPVGRGRTQRPPTRGPPRRPRGRAMAEEVADVNRALGQLAGRQLDAARLTWRMPGHYDLSLTVGGFALTMTIGPEGVCVWSLHTG